MLVASGAKYTLRVFHFHASGCQGQWSQHVVLYPQSLCGTPIVGLTALSSLPPCHGYSMWKSHFHIAMQTSPEVLSAHFNE